MQTDTASWNRKSSFLFIGCVIALLVKLSFVLPGLKLDLDGRVYSLEEFLTFLFGQSAGNAGLTPELQSAAIGSLVISASLLLQASLAVGAYKILMGSRIPIGVFPVEAAVWIGCMLGWQLFFPAIGQFLQNLLWAPSNEVSCAEVVIWPHQTRSFIWFVLPALPICLFGPVSEELFYRGLLADVLRASLGIFLSFSVVLVLFVFVHPQFWGRPYDVVYIMGAAAALFAARLRFGGIGVAIAMHVAANTGGYLQTILTCQN